MGWGGGKEVVRVIREPVKKKKKKETPKEEGRKGNVAHKENVRAGLLTEGASTKRKTLLG